MASANKVFVSPGVYTSERDLSFVSQSVGVTTLGLVGETLKGPAFEPVFVTSYDEFTSYFGGTNPEKFVNTQIPKYEAAYIAKSYLQQSNQLFVTRVLGLSGYDAGPSWTVKSVANVDCSTVGIDSGSNWTTSASIAVGFNFQSNGGTASGIDFYEISTDMPSWFNSKLDVSFVKYDGTSSTVRSEMQNFLWNTFYKNMTTVTLPTGLYNTNVVYFGAIPTTQYTTYNAYTGKTNVYGIDTFNASAINYCDGLNDSWFYSLFDPIPGTDNYSGFSFVLTQNNITFGTFSGYDAASNNGLTIGYQLFTGITYTEYHNLVLATLRSRGITNYNSTQHGPKYQVTGTSDVSLTVTGAYSAATTNPYSTFLISGTQYDSTTFSFETSFETANTNYINKVFGQDNFEKDRAVVPLFVEESYDTLLTWGYNKGYIRGLNTTLTSLDSAESQSSTSLGNYLERYQTPTTPYVVSELRGTKVYDLFRFVSISDGTAANTEIKVSIQNMSFNNLTFDVVVRDYNDTDANPVVLEKFTNCTMNPDLNSYIAKRIGTSDGEFAINSRYVMLEVNYEAPYDALPCGFNGYVTRNYGPITSVHPAFPIYKTSYAYPGEVIWNPPFGTSVGVDNKEYSTGDNVRRTFLGFSTKLGYDGDFLQYKGKQNLITGFNSCTLNEADFDSWNYLTKGFHMDSGATVITIASNYLSSGDTAFEVGAGSFQSEPLLKTDTYYYLYSRKFSMLFYGGFDGWDIYRETRTNSDDYILGGTGFLAGSAPCSPYTTASGWGSFRRITIDQNSTDWANTDYYAYLLGIQTFANPEVTNINVLTTPGIDYVNNYELVNATIGMVEFNRADSIYITTTPDFDLLQPSTVIADNLIFPEEAVVNLEDSSIDSNYTATYYPWVLTRDTVNNTQLYIPPTAEVTRNLALTDNVAFPWFATAGYTRGIVNAVRARKRLTQEDRDILYKGRINPIATFNDVGTVIWGNKTLQIRESALDRINVRRLLLQARKLISAVAVRLLFEQNDALVRQQFLDSVNPILDAIRRDRGLYDFRVTVSNTPEDLDANQLVGKIYIKPTKALEFIDIEFLITPTGASFENI